MKITLNLASRPFTDLTDVYKKLRVVMGGLVVAALLVGLILHFVLQRDQRAYDRAHLLDKAVADLMKERQGYETMMQQPANAKVLDETDALNVLFDEKAFSWTLVMKDLETVLPGPVQITTIEPARSKDGQVVLHLRVLGPRTQTIKLVENMEHSDRFRKPRIIGESPESDAGSNGKVQAVRASSLEDLDLLTDYNLTPAGSYTQPPAAAKASPAAAPAHTATRSMMGKSSPSKPAGGQK